MESLPSKSQADSKDAFPLQGTPAFMGNSELPREVNQESFSTRDHESRKSPGMQTKMRHLSKPVITLLVICSLMLLSTSIYAQAPAPQNPTGGGGFLIRPLWTEIIITIVMIGAALFAIGRSSNRN